MKGVRKWKQKNISRSEQSGVYNRDRVFFISVCKGIIFHLNI